ncbi:hypothetical protein D3C72_1158200 [compost metagenome]
MARVAGAEDGHLGAVQRGGHVHQAGVVADGRLGQREQVHRVVERGLAAQVAHERRSGDDLRRNLRILGRTERDDLRVRERAAQHLRQFGEVGGGPALGRAELRARAERNHPGLRRDAEALGRGGHALGLHAQLRVGNVLGQAPAGLEGQPCVVLHHRRALVARRVGVAHVEHAEARLAAIADAQRNARQERNQRRFE